MPLLKSKASSGAPRGRRIRPCQAGMGRKPRWHLAEPRCVSVCVWQAQRPAWSSLQLWLQGRSGNWPRGALCPPPGQKLYCFVLGAISPGGKAAPQSCHCQGQSRRGAGSGRCPSLTQGCQSWTHSLSTAPETGILPPSLSREDPPQSLGGAAGVPQKPARGRKP